MSYLGLRRICITLLVLAAAASALPAAAQSDFYTIPPCRVYDSRGNGGPLSQGTTYDRTVTGPPCNVPAGAKAVSLNVTVVGATGAGELAIFPTGTVPPFVGTLPFKAGRTQAIIQLVGLNASGQLSVRATIPSGPGLYQVVLDVFGYYLDNTVLANDQATVAEDAAATAINVLANDTDPDDTLVIASATDPANGTVVLTGGSPGAHTGLTYQPDADYCNDPPGTTLDTFSYTVNTGSIATVEVTVTCVDDHPVAVDDAATVAEDAAATAINVLANDTDVENDTFSIASASSPANGTVVLTGGSPGAHTGLTYEPDDDYCGADSFTYTLNPGGDSATVSVTVTCADGNPVAVDDAATVAEDAGATAVNVLANDTDEENDPFFIASASDPANGTVVLTGGTPGAHTGLTYQPDANFCGADSFTYTLTPGGDSATVSVTVTCVDDNPVAVDDAARVAEDAAATAINVLANDSDPENGAFSIASASDPANGTVVLTPAGPGPYTGLTYQPDANFCGGDSFTYTLTPGGDSATVSVTVTCLDGSPVAGDDTATVAEDSGATAVNVLSNDTDEEGDPFFIASASDPANGTVALTGGTPGAHTGLTYQPDANFCGGDSFTYTLTPGGDSASVSVTVTCLNDAPAIDLDANDDKGTAGSDFAVTFTEGDAAKLIEDPADAVVTDIDSATLTSLTVTLTNLLDQGDEALDVDLTGFPGISKSYDTTTDPLKGVLTLTGPDTLANFQAVLRKVTYHNSDEDPDTTARVIEFVANDGTADSVAATATVTVLAVNSNPVAVDDAANVAEDAAATAINVLANDTDAENDSFFIASASDPANGTVVLTGGTPGAHTGLTYQPDANFCGPDSFTYTLTPGGDTGSVSVTVTCVNDNPVAVDDAANVAEDAAATAINVLANDTDAENDSFTIASASDPAHGTVVLTPAGGPFTGLTYQPDANYCGSDSFTYTLTPGGDTGAVSVTVTCVDDTPVAQDDAAVVLEDAAATAINVLANDSDLENDTFSIASASDPANGTVVLTPAGGPFTGLAYQPDANFCGADSFTYTLTPGGDSASVSVTVTCVDDPPVAVADAQTVLEDAAATPINVLANDTDIDGGPKTISSATDPSNGTVVLTGGSPGAHTGLTYQPDPNYCNNPPGTTLDTFSYTVNGGSVATVSVTVTCVNDAPVLTNNPISYTTPGHTQLHVGASTIPGVASWSDAQAALTKSAPTDVDGPVAPKVVPASGSSANGGSYSIDADGNFTYVPPLNFTGTDSFTYQVTDTVVSAVGTINITVGPRVWYIHDETGLNNPAGGDGRSNNPFDSIAGFNTATTNNGDIIYVFEGNTGTTPHTGSITLKDGQKLWGQGIALNVPGFGTPLANAANKPRIQTTTASTDVVSVPATAGNRSNVEIRGLDLEATGATSNAIDVTSSGANTVGITISNNNVRGATAEGIDLNAGASGAFSATIQNNTVTAAGNGIDARSSATGTTTVTASVNMITSTAGNAFDARTLVGAGALRVALDSSNVAAAGTGILIDGSAAGTTTITSFSNNVVDGGTVGTGINVTSAIFDGTPSGTFQTIAAGNTGVGAAINGVGGSGMVLTNVQGDLSFTDLDVYADGGAGLRASSTTAYTGSAGLRIVVPASVSVIEATGGPAVDVTQATVTLPFTSIKSTNSSTTGLALNSVAGSFSAGSGSSISNITNASGTAFQVGNSSATVSYAGTINTNQGKGVDLTSNTGSISFTGTLTLSTGTQTAFNATGGGTVTATDTASTLATTTGRALNVANTTIGAGGLKFRSISSNGAVNGIMLNTTGSSGGLTVSGNGGSCTVATPTCTGGTIQGSTGAGISLSSTSGVNLSLMRVNGGGDDGIVGSNVTGFTLANSLVTNNGNALGENGLDFTGLLGSASITSSTISGSHNNNVTIRNSNGTLSMLTVTGSTFSSNVSTSDGDGLLFEASGTANMSINVSGSAFSAHHSDHFQASALNSGVLNVVFSGNTLSGGHAAPLGQGITINAATGAPGYAGSVTYDLNGNTINGAISNAIMANLGTSSAAATFSGQIRNNVIGTSGSALSCSTQANGINVEAHGNGTHTVSVTGNTIRRCFDRGINVLASDGNGALNLTATNNTVNDLGDTNNVTGTPREAFLLQAGATSTNIFGQVDSHAVCMNLSGPSGSLIGGAHKTGDIRVRQRFRTSVRMPGYAGSAFDTAAVISFLQGNNPASTATATANNDAAVTTDGYFGGAACPLP